MALGGVFFGGLWWTVQRLPEAERPFRLYFGSLVIRLGTASLGFVVLLLLTDWPQLVAALIGFLLSRLILTMSIRRGTPIKEVQR